MMEACVRRSRRRRLMGTAPAPRSSWTSGYSTTPSSPCRDRARPECERQRVAWAGPPAARACSPRSVPSGAGASGAAPASGTRGGAAAGSGVPCGVAAALARPARARTVAPGHGCSPRASDVGPDAAPAAEPLDDLGHGRPEAHVVGGASGNERWPTAAAPGAPRRSRTAPGRTGAGDAQLHEAVGVGGGDARQLRGGRRRPRPSRWRRRTPGRCGPRRSRPGRPAHPGAPRRRRPCCRPRSGSRRRDAAGRRGRPAPGWPPTSRPR